MSEKVVKNVRDAVKIVKKIIKKFFKCCKNCGRVVSKNCDIFHDFYGFWDDFYCNISDIFAKIFKNFATFLMIFLTILPKSPFSLNSYFHCTFLNIEITALPPPPSPHTRPSQRAKFNYCGGGGNNHTIGKSKSMTFLKSKFCIKVKLKVRFLTSISNQYSDPKITQILSL